MKEITTEQKEEILNENTDFFDKINNQEILESALYHSVRNIKKEMITYFTERGIKLKHLHIEHVLRASDNLKYVKFLEGKGIDIYSTSRIVVDAIRYARDKTAVYLFKNYKGEKDIFTKSVWMTIDSLNSEKKPNKIKGFQNIVAEIFALADPELKNQYFSRIKSEENKSIILEKYLELKIKNVPAPINKNKSNKI